jgi:parvulin-like peptidyl-prolyl isomerase
MLTEWLALAAHAVLTFVAQGAPGASPERSEAEPVDGIVALANKHVITRLDVERRVGPALRALADPEKARELWRKQVHELIMEKLEVDAAMRSGLRVEPKAVDRSLRERIEGAGGRDSFLNYLAQNGQTEQQFREDVEHELLRLKYYYASAGMYLDADKRARPDVDIEPTVAEMKEYYHSHPQEFTIPARARVRQIYLRNSNFRSPEECRAKLVDLRERILGGESFAEIANAESHDRTSAEKGGELSWIPLEGGLYQKFLTDFAAAAPIGSISEIEEVRFGCYLFKLEERTERRVQPFEEVQDQVVNRIKSQKAAAHFDRTRKRLIEESEIWAPDLPELQRKKK